MIFIRVSQTLVIFHFSSSATSHVLDNKSYSSTNHLPFPLLHPNHTVSPSCISALVQALLWTCVQVFLSGLPALIIQVLFLQKARRVLFNTSEMLPPSFQAPLHSFLGLKANPSFDITDSLVHSSSRDLTHSLTILVSCFLSGKAPLLRVYFLKSPLSAVILHNHVLLVTQNSV